MTEDGDARAQARAMLAALLAQAEARIPEPCSKPRPNLPRFYERRIDREHRTFMRYMDRVPARRLCP
jgi:hypothetical protein